MLTPLSAVAAVTVPAALVSYACIRQWPQHDLAAPSFTPEGLQNELRRHPRLRAALRSRLDPTKETGLLLSAGVAVLVVGVSGFGLVAAMVRTRSGLATQDLFLATWGAEHATATSTSGLKLVSLLGGYPPLVVLSVLVACVEWRRRRTRAVVPLLTLVVGGQFALANAVKFFVDRARPDISRLTGFAGSSFPSGHAAAAAASYAVFALVLGRGRRPRAKAVLGGAAVGVAVAVASTRVLLGVHWLTDVVAGLFIGWAWFALVSLAFGGRLMRFGAPVQQAEAIDEWMEGGRGEEPAMSVSRRGGPGRRPRRTGR